MKLQFTNGYRPRFDQISRIMHFLLTKKDCPKVSRQEIISALGIPDNQIKNLISMMTGFGLVKPRVSLLTPLGETLIRHDPYFEKTESMWIIHYLVSSNPEWVVWYRIINQVLPAQDSFDVDDVSIKYFSDLFNHFSVQAVTKKLPKEVGAVFASYTRNELSHLNLLHSETTGHFIKSVPVVIPDLAFLFCVNYFRDRHAPGASAQNIVTLSSAEHSPGKVLSLAEYQVRGILENLHNAGVIRLEKFANLDQVRFPDDLSSQTILRRVYENIDA